MTQKTPCPNFEIYTEFNKLVYGVITITLLHDLMIFLSSVIFFLWNLRLSAVRQKKMWSDDSSLRKQQKKHAKEGVKATTSKKRPVPILEAQNFKKDTLSQSWNLKKGTLSRGTSPVPPSMEVPPQGLDYQEKILEHQVCSQNLHIAWLQLFLEPETLPNIATPYALLDLFSSALNNVI